MQFCLVVRHTWAGPTELPECMLNGDAAALSLTIAGYVPSMNGGNGKSTMGDATLMNVLGSTGVTLSSIM